MTRNSIVPEVIKAVAAADGVEQAEVGTLYDYINPEILENVVEQDRGKCNLTFQFSDHQVTITNDSQIYIDGVQYTPEYGKRQHKEADESP
jgi:hypothetical protein